MIVFEFFSGIGGIHQALFRNNIQVKEIFPYDINQKANETYKYNFNINPFVISLESFSPEEYEKICLSLKLDSKINEIMWTMSPPCQPFTRQGNEKGLDDDRSNGYKNLLKILEVTKFPPSYFFLENVKNFEVSEACAILVKLLSARGYFYNQFLISPHSFGVPNSRTRFYLTARLGKKFNYIYDGVIDGAELLEKCMLKTEEPIEVYKVIEYNEKEEESKKAFYLDEKILEKIPSQVIDLCTLNSKKTNCFTKGYGKLFKGAGSFLLINEEKYNETQEIPHNARYFTPEEVQKLMCFNEKFGFPDNIDARGRYKLLGNSVNVKVVAILLDYLVKTG